MLCTQCSSNVKPVVAFDIDGTLGDYHGPFIDFAKMYLGVKARDHTPTYNGLEEFKDYFRQWYGVDRRTWYDIKLAYRQGGNKRWMPIHMGARRLVHYARTMGAEVWITTSRPYNRLDNVDPDTREWLRRNLIEFDHLMYDDDKYKVLAERVDPKRVVAVLDDLGDMYDAAHDAFGPQVPILRVNNYNLGVRRPVMVTELQREAKVLIGQRIAAWKNS